MIEFLRKNESRGIKIARVNSIPHRIYQLTDIYFNFVRCLGPLWSKAIFRAHSVNKEVYVVEKVQWNSNNKKQNGHEQSKN